MIGYKLGVKAAERIMSGFGKNVPSLGAKLNKGVSSASALSKKVATKVSGAVGLGETALGSKAGNILPPAIQSLSSYERNIFRYAGGTQNLLGRMMPKTYLQGAMTEYKKQLAEKNLGQAVAGGLKGQVRTAGMAAVMRSTTQAILRGVPGEGTSGLVGMRSRVVAGFDPKRTEKIWAVGTARPVRKFAMKTTMGAVKSLGAPGRRGRLARGGLYTGATVFGMGAGAYGGLNAIGRGPFSEPGPKSMSPKQLRTSSAASSGYVSWGKMPGSPMPANHLGTEGLTLALNDKRRRR